MNKLLRKLLICTLFLAGVPCGAMEPIDGFSKYKFGMPLSEVKNDFTLEEGKPGGDADSWFEAKETVDILGSQYNIAFGFAEGRLMQVNVYRFYTAPLSTCIFNFDKMVAAVQAKYGEPDSKPDKADPMLMSAVFTAMDGSTIAVSGSGFSQIEQCAANVAYMGKKSGTGF